MSQETDLAALADRTIRSRQGYPGIEVRWWPETDGPGHWMIKMAVAWQGQGHTRRRWIDVRAKTLIEARISAKFALDQEGR